MACLLTSRLPPPSETGPSASASGEEPDGPGSSNQCASYGRRPDVGVVPEDVLRVVDRLDLCQTCVLGPVAGSHPPAREFRAVVDVAAAAQRVALQGAP